MEELYPTLLRKVDVPKFGATLSNIVTLNKPRGKEMESRELIIVIDGDAYDPIKCGKINIDFTDSIITVNVVTKVKEKEVPVEEVKALETGIVTAVDVEVFNLVGADLEKFNYLSVFRMDANKAKNIKEGESILVESDQFNIIEMDAVDDAISNLVKKEKAHLSPGTKVVEVYPVEYKYIDEDNFTLVETVVLHSNVKILD